MRVEFVDYAEAKMLHPITRDYIAQSKRVDSLYEFAPTFKELERSLEERASYPVDRVKLVDSLLNQYGSNATKAEVEVIKSLENENAFTTTTGHQLNLFTGPLYFIYKIFSVIKMAERLEEAHPDKRIIPVYWMATEDHDFDEINHFHLAHKAFRWENDQTGPVGKFSIEELKPLLDRIETELGVSIHAKQVIEPFLRAYRNGDNLTQATRLLVQSLFKGYPLVIVDGDDAQLKEAFIPAVEHELFSSGSQPLVEGALNTWKKLGYKPQVPGRSINLFYIADGLRERIEKTAEGFQVVNTSLRFSEDEMRMEVNEHPERFSPNVILRPVYQEMILPNLSYVGGGAEVAYWLQLKAVFQELGVFFPQVMLRDAFVVLGDGASRKMDQESIEPIEIFHDIDELLKAHVLEEKGSHLFFEGKHNELTNSFTSIVDRMKHEEATLEKAAVAELKKLQNSLKRLEKKLIRAEKKNAEVVSDRLYAVKEEALPNGKVQERYINVLQMFLAYGQESFLQSIYEHCDAFDLRLKILRK